MDEKRKLERFDLQVPVKIEVVKRDREKGMLDLLTRIYAQAGHSSTPPNPCLKGPR